MTDNTASSHSIWNRLKVMLGERDDAGGAGADDDQKVRVAAAVLLLEVERADQRLSSDEREIIRTQLTDKFRLSAVELNTVLELAEARAQSAVSLHPYLRVLNRNLTPAQKLTVMEMLWQVAYADGTLDKYEEALLRNLAELLHVPHHDFIRAKLRVSGEE